MVLLLRQTVLFAKFDWSRPQGSCLLHLLKHEEIAYKDDIDASWNGVGGNEVASSQMRSYATRVARVYLRSGSPIKMLCLRQEPVVG